MIIAIAKMNEGTRISATDRRQYRWRQKHALNGPMERNCQWRLDTTETARREQRQAAAGNSWSIGLHPSGKHVLPAQEASFFPVGCGFDWGKIPQSLLVPSLASGASSSQSKYCAPWRERFCLPPFRISKHQTESAEMQRQLNPVLSGSVGNTTAIRGHGGGYDWVLVGALCLKHRGERVVGCRWSLRNQQFDYSLHGEHGADRGVREHPVLWSSALHSLYANGSRVHRVVS